MQRREAKSLADISIEALVDATVPTPREDLPYALLSVSPNDLAKTLRFRRDEVVTAPFARAEPPTVPFSLPYERIEIETALFARDDSEPYDLLTISPRSPARPFLVFGALAGAFLLGLGIAFAVF